MQFQFDSSSVEIQDYPPPFTAHSVAAKIIREEPTEGGLIFYIQLLEGEFEGREIREQMSFGSSNETAARIANQTLAQYCQVTGMRGFSATEQLFNIPFRIDCAPDKSGTYTNIKKRYDIQGNQPWSSKRNGVQAFPQEVMPAYPPAQPAFQSPAFQPPAAPSQPPQFAYPPAPPAQPAAPQWQPPSPLQQLTPSNPFPAPPQQQPTQPPFGPVQPQALPSPPAWAAKK